MHLCVGTSLAVIMPTSLRSFFSHKAKGAVDMDIIRSMALPVVAGVVVGAVVARYSNNTILTAIWAGAATVMSLKLFFGRASWKLGDKTERARRQSADAPPGPDQSERTRNGDHRSETR